MFIIYVEAPPLPLHIDWALYLKDMEINKPCPPPSPIPHPPSPIPHPLWLIGATTVFEPPLRWSLTLAIFPPHVNCKKLEHDWVQIHHHQPPPFFFL